METTSLIELIERLCKPSRRHRTGLWLVPNYLVGKEEYVVAQLSHNCDAIDLRSAVLKRRPSSTRYSGISPEAIHGWIDSVLEQDVTCDCAVLYHLDLLLAYLQGPERDQVWGTLMSSFVHRSKALVFAFPQRAVGVLLKEEIIERWCESQRLAAEEK